jgi:hypothetical protein
MYIPENAVVARRDCVLERDDDGSLCLSATVYKVKSMFFLPISLSSFSRALASFLLLQLTLIGKVIIYYAWSHTTSRAALTVTASWRGG